jgi:hypothetical protein
MTRIHEQTVLLGDESDEEQTAHKDERRPVLSGRGVRIARTSHQRDRGGDHPEPEQGPRPPPARRDAHLIGQR